MEMEAQHIGEADAEAVLGLVRVPPIFWLEVGPPFGTRSSNSPGGATPIDPDEASWAYGPSIATQSELNIFEAVNIAEAERVGHSAIAPLPANAPYG